MSMKGIGLIFAGAVLLLFSAWPLYLMGQELFLERKVQQQADIDRIYVNFLELGKVEILGRGVPIPVTRISVRNRVEAAGESREPLSYVDYYRYMENAASKTVRYAREYTWENQVIRIEDETAPGELSSDSRSRSPLRITINQNDWSVSDPVEVRPYFLDENRYHGYFGVLIVRHRDQDQLVLVQRISEIGDFHAPSLAWRVLAIDPDGQVREERFEYGERADDPIRVKYVQQSSASPISFGYRSNMLQVWPSLWFPLLYPWTTGGFGLLLLAAGGAVRWADRRKNKSAGHRQ